MRESPSQTKELDHERFNLNRSWSSETGFVTGLSQEARIARRLGGRVAIGGGTEEGARKAALTLAEQGASRLVSFGLAGALDPTLRSGDLLLPARVLTAAGWVETAPELVRALGGPTPHTVLGVSAIAGTMAEKQRLRASTSCSAIDLESGAVAEVGRERGLPVAVLRAICDPADFSLPPAALIALSATGTILPFGVLLSVLRHPSQIPALLRLSRHAARARRTLLRAVRELAACPLPPPPSKDERAAQG